jgi:hypothetical protein
MCIKVADDSKERGGTLDVNSSGVARLIDRCPAISKLLGCQAVSYRGAVSLGDTCGNQTTAVRGCWCFRDLKTRRSPIQYLVYLLDSGATQTLKSGIPSAHQDYCTCGALSVSTASSTRFTRKQIYMGRA